jgi:hypothetical protein
MEMGDGNTCQRRQQSRPGGMPAEQVADKRPDTLQHRADETRKQTGLPGKVRIFGFEIDRGNYQENKGNETYGVDAVRQRGDIRPSGPDGQLSCLPCIEQVAEQDRKRSAGQYPAENKIRRHAAYITAEDSDQHQLQQIVDEQPEETVNISTNKPSNFHNVRFLFERLA